MSIDNFATGRRNNLLDPKSLRKIKGTISDGALINRLLAEFKPDLVVRTAASYKNPENWKTDALVNAVGGANIAKACKIHKAGRLIYFQTALCYGTKPTQQPIRLDDPINPVNSSYAVFKTAGEHYVQFSGVDRITFRLADVIGPRNVSGPLPIFYGRLATGQKCFVTPAQRDFCFAG
jgi:UDP-glucose 4-epimerase